MALVVKNPPANAGDVRDAGSIPGWGRSPGVGRGKPLKYSCLENPMDKGTWQAIVYGVERLNIHTHMCLCTWVTLLYSRDWHTINQLHLNKKDNFVTCSFSSRWSFKRKMGSPLLNHTVSYSWSLIACALSPKAVLSRAVPGPVFLGVWTSYPICPKYPFLAFSTWPCALEGWPISWIHQVRQPETCGYLWPVGTPAD